jgi:hypothetical protein
VTRMKKARQKRKKGGHLGKTSTLLRNLPKNAKLVGAIPGMPKMSGVFLEFLEPYWKNEDQLKKLLPVGTIAWNAACVSGQQRAELIEPCLAACPADFRQDLKQILDELISRKQTKFASDQRLIFNYELTTTREGPHLIRFVQSNVDLTDGPRGVVELLEGQAFISVPCVHEVSRPSPC